MGNLLSPTTPVNDKNGTPRADWHYAEYRRILPQIVFFRYAREQPQVPNVSGSEPQWSDLRMWISLFGITTAAAIGLSVAAVMLQELSGRKSLCP